MTLDELRAARDALRAGKLRGDEIAEWWQSLIKDISMDGDEALFPRRRDVRNRCEVMREVLNAHYAELYPNDGGGEFDRDFLTSVRDLMREGMSFEDAVGGFVLYVDDPSVELMICKE